MERDAVLGHGSPYFLRERLLDMSDPLIMDICKVCGWFCVPKRPRHSTFVVKGSKPFCTVCKSSENVVAVRMPHAFKLMTMELAAMDIGLNFEI